TLEQGTTEWLTWRHEGIGASEASTIMGENRFESAASLLHKKCSPPVQGRMNRAMAQGFALEPKARAYYNSRLELDAEPKCLQSLGYDWLRASLDGITKDGSRVVEIKCGESAYKTSIKTRRPPRYYYGQFQHIMAVTGLECVDYCCYFPPGRPVVLQVQRNQPYIDTLLEAEQAFWTEVIKSRKAN
ncbi:MAG TPA: YqaJ viral recombinase family protein, partial [Luteolibacter sp.]